MSEMMLSTGQGQTARQRTEQQLRQDASLHAKTDLLNSATLEQTDAILNELVAEGEIVFDLLPAADDLPLEDDGETLDAEWDFSDEDALSADDNSDAFLPEAKGLFAPEGGYRIQVAVGDDGRMRCIPPVNKWGAARGLTPYGIRAIRKVTTRMEALEAVSAWLEEKFRSRLADGPEGFLDGWKPRPQKEFLDWCASKADKAPHKASFSKFIRNVRLSWDEGSIPLQGGVFNAR